MMHANYYEQRFWHRHHAADGAWVKEGDADAKLFATITTSRPATGSTTT